MTLFVHGGISKKIFVVYMNMVNETFSQKFHPYSILSTETKYESVAFWVLKRENCAGYVSDMGTNYKVCT